MALEQTPTLPPQLQQATQAKGPQYIDDHDCRCALEVMPVEWRDESKTLIWRCSGNAQQDLYDGTLGKWYMPQSEAANKTEAVRENPIWGDENAPDVNKTYVLDGSRTGGDRWEQITRSNSNRLGAEDHRCTGKNDTDASTKYYKLMTTQLCSLSKLAAPIPLMMNGTQWNETGCLEGFFCPNNDAQYLPMSCPPAPDCLLARLSGDFCYPSMGQYEPQICRPGFYCPKGGTEQITCPKGYYCPVGSKEPLKCTLGASCPQESDRNLTWLPFGLLILLNVLMISLLVATRLVIKRKKTKWRRSQGLKGMMKGATSIVDLNQKHKRYHSLPEPDPALALEARISTVKRQNTGFLAAVDNDWVYDERGSSDEKPGTDMQLFVQSMSKCINGSNFGLSFEFEDLKFQPKSGKVILSNITGKIDSGALWAIMGASGAGKTTFVNVLMGKIRNTGGVTRVNGVAGNISKYKKIIGYVPQDDIVLPELTVRENILHSARIRLPSRWNDSEIQHHVDVLISCLQLSHVKDSLVGSPAKPVISGGQRKRVSIGMELAAAPMALFLDEPTSGLDATSASSIMQMLKAVSRIGITVVTIIHQPRQEIFASIDNLLLLGAGRMIYQGPTGSVASYFGDVGFTFPPNANPADVLMDIIAGQGRLYKRIGETSIEALIEHWNSRHQSHSRNPSTGSNPAAYEDTVALRRSIRARGAAVHKQIWFCLARAMLQQYRSLSSFYFELGVGALAGFLIGLAHMSKRGVHFVGVYHIPFSPLSSASDYSSTAQMSLLVGVAIGLTAAAPGVKVFGEEKLVFYREAASGHNRFAYFIGKVLSTFPRMLLANLHFTIMFLLLSTPKIGFGAAFAADFLYFYCIYGLASIISVLTKREDGPLLAVMGSLIVSVLNGMSPSLAQVTSWRLGWLWRLIPGTWLAEAYFTENVNPWRYLYVVDELEAAIGYKIGQFGLDLGMLFVLGTAYRVIAFLALRFLNRSRQT